MLPVGSRVEYFSRGIITRKWYFRLVGPNNRIIAQSQGYKSKVNCLQTVDRYFPEWDVINHDRAPR